MKFLLSYQLNCNKKIAILFLVNRVYDKTRKLMSNSIKKINRRTRGENCWIIPLGLLLKDYSITFISPSANSFFLAELLISFQTIEIVLTVVVIIIILIIKSFCWSVNNTCDARRVCIQDSLTRKERWRNVQKYNRDLCGSFGASWDW